MRISDAEKALDIILRHMIAQKAQEFLEQSTIRAKLYSVSDGALAKSAREMGISRAQLEKAVQTVQNHHRITQKLMQSLAVAPTVWDILLVDAIEYDRRVWTAVTNEAAYLKLGDLDEDNQRALLRANNFGPGALAKIMAMTSALEDTFGAARR